MVRDKLSRDSAQRFALIKNMTRSYFKSENCQIMTTLIRAKVVRKNIEKIITTAKQGMSNQSNMLSATRYLTSYLGSKELVDKVMDQATKMQNRAGGYTRVLKAGFRKGDNACVAYIQTTA